MLFWVDAENAACFIESRHLVACMHVDLQGLTSLNSPRINNVF